MDVHLKWIKAVPLQEATTATTVSALQTFLPTLGYSKNWWTVGPSLLQKPSQTTFARLMESNRFLPSCFESGSRMLSTGHKITHKKNGPSNSI